MLNYIVWGAMAVAAVMAIAIAAFLVRDIYRETSE